MNKILLTCVFIFSVVLFPLASVVQATGSQDNNSNQEQSDIEMIEGPTTVVMGDNLVTLEVQESHYYLDAENTVKYNELLGNFATGTEIGMVLAEDESWFVVFEYEEVGYIEDQGSEEIDAEALLESYKEGVKEQNEELVEAGFAPSTVVGWDEKPSYDKKTHNLVWSIIFESEGYEYINHNTRLLNRYGHVSATLVADPSNIDVAKAELDKVLANFSFNEGKRYEDFDPKTDKIAEYGLQALVLGGVGAAAVKSGILATILALFKKFFVVIIAVAGGAFAWIKKRLGKNKQTRPVNEETENHN